MAKVFSDEEKKKLAELREEAGDEFQVGLASKSNLPESAVPKKKMAAA